MENKVVTEECEAESRRRRRHWCNSRYRRTIREARHWRGGVYNKGAMNLKNENATKAQGGMERHSYYSRERWDTRSMNAPCLSAETSHQWQEWGTIETFWGLGWGGRRTNFFLKGICDRYDSECAVVYDASGHPWRTNRSRLELEAGLKIVWLTQIDIKISK